MPIQLPEDEGTLPPPRGSIVVLIPRHVCPTVNLAEEVLLVDGGEGDARSYTVVPVVGRGHELLVGSSQPSVYCPPDTLLAAASPAGKRNSELQEPVEHSARSEASSPLWKRQRRMLVG